MSYKCRLCRTEYENWSEHLSSPKHIEAARKLPKANPLELHTFKQPVRGGYHYIVIKSTDKAKAAERAVKIVMSLPNRTGRLVHLSTFDEAAEHLVLQPEMEEKLQKFGYAHIFVPE